MTYDQIAREVDDLFRTLQGIVIAGLIYFGAFIVAAVPAIFTGMGVASLFADVTSHSTLVGWLVGIALEVVNIIVIHTASEFYADKPTGRFWILVGLIPVYVVGVELVMVYSDDAFPPLVKSLGMVSPFFAIAVFIAVMFNQWHKAAKLESSKLEEEETAQQLERERLELQHKYELERLALEHRHSEKLARIEAKSVSRTVSKLSQDDTPNVSRLSQTEIIEQILRHLETNGDTAMTHLAKTLGISRSTLYRRIDELQQAGRLHKNGEGWKVN